jgi:hypothetical protein
MRVSRMLTVCSLALCTGCGFHMGSSHQYSGGPRCDGEEYLQVFNPYNGAVDIYGNAAVDIYGNAGPGTEQLLGTAARGESTIPLSATRYEGHWSGFYARAGNQYLSEVRITRQCAK